MEYAPDSRALVLPCLKYKYVPPPPPPPHFRTLLGKEGWPKGFIRKVPLYLSVFSTGHSRLFRMPLVVVKKISFAIVQRLGKGMPAVAGAETWAFKNTMLAVQVNTSRSSRSSMMSLQDTKLCRYSVFDDAAPSCARTRYQRVRCSTRFRRVWGSFESFRGGGELYFEDF